MHRYPLFLFFFWVNHRYSPTCLFLIGFNKFVLVRPSTQRGIIRPTESPPSQNLCLNPELTERLKLKARRSSKENMEEKEVTVNKREETAIGFVIIDE